MGDIMRTHPIKQNPLLLTLKESVKPSLKSFSNRILSERQPICVDTFSKINMYQFDTNSGGKVQIIINKLKSLITDVITLNKENVPIEEIHYDYGNKGQMIRANKKGISANGKKNSVRTNIKYTGDEIVVSKDINHGTINIKTIFGKKADKKSVDLTITKNNENTVENVLYVEDTKLQTTIVKGDEVKFEGFGDPNSGEMVFSKSKFHPQADMECCELMDNGMYHKQVYFDNFKTVISRDVAPNSADCFGRIVKDMMTPQQELAQKLKQLLD